MTTKPLLPVLLTAALVLAVLNLGLGVWSHRLPYAQKLESIRTAHDPNLLLVGNSLLDHHLDEAALTQSAAQGNLAIRPLNSALGASEPPEQRLLFNYALRNHAGIRTLVVGVYDFQLTAEDHSRLTDLTGNRMVGINRRFRPADVAAVYGFGTLERMEIGALQWLPMAANRANIWKYVELLRRSMEAMGMPAEATNSMGRVGDFAALEAGSPQIFDAQARRFLDHPDGFNASYEAIFGEARRRGIDVVVVVMPMSPYHHEVFYIRPVWKQYLDGLGGLARARSIQVIDASDWMPDAGDFADHLHMTQDAAHRFSMRLGVELVKAAR
jgi:hypothetical protein